MFTSSVEEILGGDIRFFFQASFFKIDIIDNILNVTDDWT